jgi:hypothetical protein
MVIVHKSSWQATPGQCEAIVTHANSCYSRTNYCVAGKASHSVHFCHPDNLEIFMSYQRNLTDLRRPPNAATATVTGPGQRGKHISCQLHWTLTYSKPPCLQHAHRYVLCLCAGRLVAHALSPSQAHDWFSDVLTGGLILGLCISYAPQVRVVFPRASSKS